jgi:hypothetical protein
MACHLGSALSRSTKRHEDPMDILQIAVILATLLGALLGGVGSYLFQRRYERGKTTTAQLQFYHSSEMIQARYEAWEFLNTEFAANPCSFRDLFADRNGSWKAKYNSLIKVIYFWYLLATLKESRDVDPVLAKRLFAYQFRSWREALLPLHRETKRDLDESSKPVDAPEWLAIMDPDRMAWLTKR